MFPGIDGKDSRRLALDEAIQLCQKALAGFPCTLEADQQAVMKLEGAEQHAEAAQELHVVASARRQKEILSIRIQERKILNRTIFVLHQQRKQR